MFKKVVTIIAVFFAFLFFSGQVRAMSPVDLTATCNGSSCVLSPSDTHLFSEKNLAPGQTITKKIGVVNNNPNDDCSLALTVKNLQDEGNLTGVLATAINDGPTNLFSDTFTQLFSVKTVNMGVVPKSGGSKSFDWIVTFDPAADNSYQNLTTKFDFDLSFTCGVPPPNPPGTTTTSTVASPPACNDAEVGGIPGSFTAASGGLGAVVLT